MPEFAVPTVFTAIDKLSPFWGKQSAAASKWESLVRGTFQRAGHEAGMFGKILGGVTLGNLAADGIRRATNEIQQFIAGSKEAAVQGAALSTAYKTVFGSDASSQMAFARNEANRLGMALQGTAQSYMSIAAAAKGTSISGATVQEIFKGVSEAATALKIPSEQASGALLAISQMISKGKVSAEELRGQLGERLPGAFQIAARAMGMTTGELDKFMSSGKLTAEKFLPAFAAQMRKEFGAGAEAAARDFGAIEQRFNNVRYTFQQGIGSLMLPVLTKLYAAVTPIINRMADWVDANHDLIATRIDQFIDNVGKFLRAAKPYFEFTIWALKNFGPPILAGVIAFKSLHGILGIVSGALAIFNAIMAANPISLIIIGISALIAVIVLLVKHWDDVTAAARSAWEWMQKVTGLSNETQTQINQNATAAPPPGAFQSQYNLSTIRGIQDPNAPTAASRDPRIAPKREAPNAARAAKSEWSGRLDIAGAPAGSKFTQSGSAPIRAELLGANP